MRKKPFIKFLKWFFGIIGGFFILITFLLYIFKDDICNAVIAEMNKHLKSKVKVSDVDVVFWGTFPNLSVDFSNVFIQDSYEKSTERDTLFYSDRVRLKFNPLDVLGSNYDLHTIEVAKGVVHLKVDTVGQNNYDILKESKENGSSDFNVNLKNVEFTDFRVIYENKGTDQLYSATLSKLHLSGALSSEKFTAEAKAQMKINDARSGALNFVRNQQAKLDIRLKTDMKKGTLSIPNSTIFISNLPFTFKGDVDSSGYQFDLHAKQIKLTDVAKNLAMDETKKVTEFRGKGDLQFDLNIRGKNDPLSPVLMDCEFGVTDGQLTDPSTGVTLSKLNVSGKYSNSEGPENEALTLSDLSFETAGNPFKGELKITHFDKPLVEGKAFGLINLGIIQTLFSVPKLDKLRGQADVGAKFKMEMIPDEIGDFDINIIQSRGDVKLINSSFQLKEDSRYFHSINGKLFLSDNEAGIKNLGARLGKSDFQVSGTFGNIMRFFFGKGNLNVDLEMTSDFVNVDDLGSTYEVKSKQAAAIKSHILPMNIAGDVYLDLKRIDYEGHQFYNVKGNMEVGKRVLDFKSVTLRNAGASISGKMTISETLPELFNLKLKVGSEKIELKSAFKEWNNFMQDVITDKNISGKTWANLDFEAPFDLEKGILSSGIVATLKLKVTDGRLLNVSSFKEITESLRTSYLKTILGKSNIDHLEKELLDLKFKTLKNTLIIRDGMITIPEMSVESSALDMEISGKHTFENQIDYRFGFRFRDLKVKKESEFGEIIDDGTGMRVFMRMYGNLYDPTIEWDKDAMKQQRKEKWEEEKQTTKSLLKSEFGLFKNDTTVKEFVPDARPKTTLEVTFDEEEADKEIIEKKPKRNFKLGDAIKRLESESEKKKTEIEISEEDDN